MYAVISMAEGRTYSVERVSENVENDPFEYQFGVGRGFFNPLSVSRTPGQRGMTLDTPQFTSTRVSHAVSGQVDQKEDLGSLITQLAEKLGESIRAQLQPSVTAQRTDIPTNTADATLPSVSVVMHSDPKEPPIFRGDGSDKFTVHEWEGLMMMYLRKRAIPVCERSQEILARLMGKAGDVVRIKLRNNTSIDHAADPHVIFDILKQHFSELTYSSMPLAEFYNTLPTPGEDAMEYWIRLNKMVEVADECLKRQGRAIDDPQHEVSMMFIKHCPDKSLAGVFKFKSAEKWTACEIQERLDEHMLENKNKAVLLKQPLPNTAVHKLHSECQVSLATNTSGLHVDPPTVPSPVPLPAAPIAATVDGDCVRSLVNLLDRLVMQQTQVPANLSARATVAQSSQRPCRVCGSCDHSTLFHCKKENRCLKCLSPGHWKRNCPQHATPRQSQLTDNAGRQDQQLN